jgi:hypothetical protein
MTDQYDLNQFMQQRLNVKHVLEHVTIPEDVRTLYEALLVKLEENISEIESRTKSN